MIAPQFAKLRIWKNRRDQPDALLRRTASGLSSVDADERLERTVSEVYCRGRCVSGLPAQCAVTNSLTRTISLCLFR